MNTESNSKFIECTSAAWGFLVFLIIGIITGVVIDYNIPTREMTIVEVKVKRDTLAEIEKCKEAKGRFDVDIPMLRPYDLTRVLHMTCTKRYTEANKQITETIFDYEFNLE